MKIYIIGPTGSGKTTLSKFLSEKYNIKCYELDLLVFDDNNNHQRRTDKEISKMFNKIINEDNWIIEDVGRSKFVKGIEESDIIYYIKIGKIRNYLRVIKRWIKQKLKIEEYNYPPTFNQLIDMIKVTKDYYKKEPEKIKRFEGYENKVKYLSSKDIKKLYNGEWHDGK